MTNRFRRLASSVLALQLAAVAACSTSPDVRKQRFFDSGTRYFDQAKFREAAIEFRNAVQVDQKFAKARLKLAQSYERLGDVQNAYQEYVRAADLLPDQQDVQLRAGIYLLAARQFDDAKLRAEAVLALDSQNVEAQVLLGNSLAGLRNFDQAITEIEQAIRLDPTRAASYANLGVVQMRRGRADAAEAAFTRAVSLQPKWVPARLALANHYWATGKIADAERQLHEAIDLEPTNPIANRALALLYLSSNRGAAAEPYAKALASSTTPFALADFYLLQNRTGDAIAQLERLRSDAKTATPAGRRLVQARAIAGDRDGAQQLVKELLAANPKDTESLLLSGQLLAQQGKIDEALAQLKAAAEVDPNSASLQFALGRLHMIRADYDEAGRAYREVLKLNPRAAAAQVELARVELVSGHVESSIQTARDAIRNEPANLDGQITLIRGLIAARNVKEADRLLGPLLAAHPKRATLHTLRGFLAAAERDSLQARRSFEEALALDPAALDALSALVALDISTGKPAAARARIDARLAAQPDRPELLLISARVAAAAKDFDTAEQHLKRALQIDAGFLAGYRTLAEVYVAQGRLAEARRELETFVVRQPKSVAALTMLGMLAESQQDSDAAQQHYERALDLEPTASVAANNLAWIYAEREQNLESALELAQLAAQALPNAAEVQDTLGWVLYKRRTSDRAVVALEQAVKLAPGNSTYRYHLGLAQIQAGNPTAARQSLERALSGAPPFPDAAGARRALADLGTTSAR